MRFRFVRAVPRFRFFRAVLGLRFFGVASLFFEGPREVMNIGNIALN